MQWVLVILLVSFFSVFELTAAKSCKNGCTVPTLIYDDLKCTPTYDTSDKCCPSKYDCSHIYNRPEGTCHLKGNFYKLGETADRELLAGRCDHASCECGQRGEFRCIKPSDTCAEFWVPEFVKPGCYLSYELNRCCTKGQICPPFDDNIKCEVNGVSYDEGKRFSHPSEKCTDCVCHKGFSGDFVAPFCQKRNCTAEIDYSKQIHNYCAPFYQSLNDCCPRSWICPSAQDEYIPASQPPTNQDLQCKFGERNMSIGDKIKQQDVKFGKIACECSVPPYLTCTTATTD